MKYTKSLDSNYNKKRLLSYAEWYTLKYFPSIKKLDNKLKEKTNNKEDIKYVIDKISRFIDEDYLINEYIKSGILLGKTSFVLRTSLINKLFNKEKINSLLLTNEKHFLDINNYKRFITKELNKLKNKGKSKKASIISVMYKYNNFKDFIIAESDKIFLDNSEDKAISNLILKFKKNNISKDKIISRLLGRGFNWEDIKKQLNK